MSEFKEFLHMGGFAFYVWSSYGLVVVVLLANVLAPWFCRRRTLHELRMDEE